MERMSEEDNDTREDGAVVVGGVVVVRVVMEVGMFRPISYM
jgi:hypothetical protein